MSEAFGNACQIANFVCSNLRAALKKLKVQNSQKAKSTRWPKSKSTKWTKIKNTKWPKNRFHHLPNLQKK